MSKSLLQRSVLVILSVTKRRITVNSRKLICAVLRITRRKRRCVVMGEARCSLFEGCYYWAVAGNQF